MAGHPALFPVGSFFDPEGHELIDHYLRRRIAGEDCSHFRSFIHDADGYSVPPGDLVENRAHAPGSDKNDGKGGEWYFFSPASRHKTKGGRTGRRQRVVAGEGYNWHSEKIKPVLDTQGNRVGHMNDLSFGIKRPGAAARTRRGWCMKEYALDDGDKQDGAARLVLCKIYVSRYKRDTTYASVINAPGSKKKRKPAADVQHPEAPRPKTPRRQEAAGGMLEEFERRFMSDQDEKLPSEVVDDGSVDPGRFFTDMREELGLTLQGNAKAAEHGGDCTLEESLAGKHGDVHQHQHQGVETVQENVEGSFQCTWDELFGEDVHQVA